MPEKFAINPTELVLEASRFPTIVELLDTTLLTRLEPCSVTGDPRHGAEAVVADPLWMLGRQWQWGELTGEDVGSPVSVQVRHRSLPVTAWAPAGTQDLAAPVEQWQWRPWPAGALLDELVEDVAGIGYEQGVRWRAQTGSHLLEMLSEAGLDPLAVDLVQRYPLAAPDDPNDPTSLHDPEAARLYALYRGHVPDGWEVRRALADDATPEWLSDDAAPALREWHAWVEGAADSGGAWTTPRLEHRFGLRVGHGADAQVFTAQSFGFGTARWHHFDWRPDAAVQLPSDADLPGVPEHTDTVLATPLRYPGMPADRYWQLEDAAIDISKIEAQSTDLARLCLAEFALTSGDDWLVVPVDGEEGALTQVLSVTVRDTFGETYVVADETAARRARGFSMYEVTDPTGSRAAPGVLLPPVAHAPMLGQPVEEVAFLRDETANMAWAVERVVPGGSGDGRRRSDEPAPIRPPFPDDLAEDDLLYELMRSVPPQWIPLVPIPVGYGRMALRKGAMLAAGEPVEPSGHLLAPTPLTFPSEEVARDGLLVQVRPALARRRDGSYARWVGHRVFTGRGEGASHLAFDSARDQHAPRDRPTPPS